MTINWFDIVDAENFILEVIKKSIPAFICYVIPVEDAFPDIHCSQRALFFSIVTKIVMFSQAYNNLKDVILV